MLTSEWLHLAQYRILLSQREHNISVLEVFSWYFKCGLAKSFLEIYKRKIVCSDENKRVICLTHCNGNSVYNSFSGNWADSAPMSTFMCLWAIYIFPGSVHIFPPAEKADPSWEYIIRSQTHECGKLGLRPRYSFSGNICFKFSAFCLCSARSIPVWPWEGWEGRRQQGRGMRWPACRAAGQAAGWLCSRTAPKKKVQMSEKWDQKFVKVIVHFQKVWQNVYRLKS